MTGGTGNERDHSDLTILDAGPILNFLSRHDTTDLYLRTLKAMTDNIIVPDAVMDEVARKSSVDRRFAACQKKLITVISGNHISKRVSPEGDDNYDFQWSWVTNNCPSSWLRAGKHRGEMVLIAHARALKFQNVDVVAMIDDQDAISLAAKAGVSSFTTVQLFQECVARGLIADRSRLRELYGYVCANDDGLLPFKLTDLNKEFPQS